MSFDRQAALDSGRLLFAVVLGVLVGSFGTWLLTRGELANAELLVVQSDRAAEAARSREALLTARIEVKEAIEHVDARNYGLMNTDLEQAALALSKVTPTTPALAATRSTLDDVRRDAATSPGEQRDALVALERALADSAGGAAPRGTF